jgi:hypothetical protein
MWPFWKHNFFTLYVEGWVWVRPSLTSILSLPAAGICHRFRMRVIVCEFVIFFACVWLGLFVCVSVFNRFWESLFRKWVGVCMPSKKSRSFLCVFMYVYVHVCMCMRVCVGMCARSYGVCVCVCVYDCVWMLYPYAHVYIFVILLFIKMSVVTTYAQELHTWTRKNYPD